MQLGYVLRRYAMPLPSVTSSEIGMKSLLLFPRENCDAMMRVNKQSVDLFRKFGVRLEPFQLTSIETMMDFTNIAKTVSANQDDEFWLELQFYRDQNHLEDVMAKMEHDEIGPQLCREFTGLVTPGSGVIMGGFSRLKV
jgi:uncharacterized protein YbaA (DUF1428 family)